MAGDDEKPILTITGACIFSWLEVLNPNAKKWILKEWKETISQDEEGDPKDTHFKYISNEFKSPKEIDALKKFTTTRNKNIGEIFSSSKVLFNVYLLYLVIV